MTKKKMDLLFNLAEELYREEYKKSGMCTPIPYAYAENGLGAFLAVSMFGLPSDEMRKKLKELDR